MNSFLLSIIMESAPVSVNTRSSVCKCDFCLIKKELSKLNQMIVCPNKILSKSLSTGGEKKKRKVSTKLKEILQPLADIQKEQETSVETSLL